MRAKSAGELEDRWRATRWFADGSNTLNLRLHRALSWLGRAERESADADAQFVFQWIAFNAMYGQAGTLPADEKDQDLRRDYFGKIVAFADAESVIYGAIWSVLRDEIEKMLDNRYVFEPYWKHRNDQAKYRDWEQKFRQAQERVARALRDTRTRDVLCELFNRLYTLRNQPQPGGARREDHVVSRAALHRSDDRAPGRLGRSTLSGGSGEWTAVGMDRHGVTLVRESAVPPHSEASRNFSLAIRAPGAGGGHASHPLPLA